MKYEIFRSGSDELLHTAETMHAFLDKDFKPMNLKRNFPEVYKTFEEIVSYEEVL